MTDMAITPTAGTPVSAHAAPPSPEKPASRPAPKTDVIDVSKPPTPEQAEHLRNTGILGYGSVSASRSASGASCPGGAGIARFTVDYQSEYFDLVNRTTVRTMSHGAGVLASNGSAFAGVTAQVSFTSLAHWPEQLEQTADTLAAAHQAKLSYLRLNCHGEDAERREAELEASYERVKDMAADSITDLLSYYLENKDKLAFRSDIQGSVRSTFSRYEAKYSDAAAQQPDGSWLGATLYESTTRLSVMGRYYIPPTQNEDGSFNLAQYGRVSLGLYSYQSILAAANPDNGARMLAKFSQTTMRVQSEISGGRIAGRASELFQISSKNAYLELLAAIDRDPSRRQLEDSFSTLA